MYLYLYDNFLNNNKFNKNLARIETRLTDLGIGGKISRLSPLKDVKELIKDETRDGVKTIVAVGNDKTVIQIINEIADYNITLGIIPIGPENKIAEVLGIPAEETACNILSARKIEKIDMGTVNGAYFLSNLSIPPQKNLSLTKLILECESSYRVIPKSEGFEINICNLQPEHAQSINPKFFNPQDGFLEIFIRPINKVSGFFKSTKARQEKNKSIVPFKKLSILAEKSINVTTDDQKILKTPLNIEVAPRKLKVIVGKNRKF